MAFQERFKLRTSFMNKEGVIGIVSQTANPIEKTPSNSQLNYFNPSRQGQNRDGGGGFSDYAKMTGTMSLPRDQTATMGMRNGVFHDTTSTPKILSRANFFKESGNMTLQLDLSKSVPLRDPFEIAQTPQASRKQNGDFVRSQKQHRSTNDLMQTKNSETALVYTNIQSTQQGKRPQQPTKPIVPNNNLQQQQPRVRVVTNVNPNPQSVAPIKPSFNFVPPQNHAKGFQHNSAMHFENPYINKYKEYEYGRGFQTQGQRVISNPIQYQQPQQNYIPQYTQSQMTITTNINANPNAQLLSHSNSGGNSRSMHGSLVDLSSRSGSKVVSVQKQRGFQSEDPSPLSQSQKFGQMTWRTVNQSLVNNDRMASGTGQSRGLHQIYLHGVDHSLSDGEVSEPAGFHKRALPDFKPYTLKQYRELKEQNVQRGGLGPNIGTEEWKTKTEKIEKMLLYSENTRLRNSKLGSKLTYNEQTNEKPLTQSSLMRIPTGKSVEIDVKSRKARLSTYDDWDGESQRERSMESSRMTSRIANTGQIRKYESQQLKVLG